MVKKRLSAAEKKRMDDRRKWQGSRARIKEFFSDPEKVARLSRMAENTARSIKDLIFPFRAGSRNLVAKLHNFEDVARENLHVLHEEHAAALKRGEINASTYIIGNTRYVLAKFEQSVTERVSGTGLDTLQDVMGQIKRGESPESIWRQFPSASPLVRQTVGNAIRFVEKYPNVIEDDIQRFRVQLNENLYKISCDHEKFSYDIVGTNNIRVRGFDLKTGRFRIALVDQIWPGKRQSVARILAKRKKQKSHKKK